MITKNTRLVILLLAMFFLVSFYLFSHEVKRGFLKQTDFNFTIVLQNHMPGRLDGVWDAIALPVTPIPSVVIVGLLTLIAFFNKRIRFRALIIPILFGLLVLGEIYGKNVVHHPAPPFFMIKNPTTIFPQFYINDQYSYPSGHTSRAVFLVMAMWMVIKRKRLWTGIALGTYVGLVALGRIYLGSHWLSDVIGGGLLGGAFGLIALASL